ncbi:OmpA family protein [Corallococcus macrosporus]|uniref:Cell envelope biogenesis protein OmpA n=1 Tax=Corallococcus macrosporus DSM 14697 TaxID=1189310 RepID=A0A250JUD6_9BACT|nr:OmpA family protein [Corallococcus macrosporus]ATB47499.1 cell envelope biogenesis protein OmpA [Corallococcus macrosporus DSM 14697]
MLCSPVAAISAQVPLLVIMGLLATSARAAEPSAVELRAREDLDRQLQAMVKKTPPPEIVISFEGLPGAGTSRGYKLVEADFLVNGQPLAIPGVDKLNGPGLHRLAVLTVEEGSYTLVSHVTYANESWNLFSEESGFLWKLTASVTVQVQRGLRARVRVLPAINPTAPDPRLKLKLSHDVVAEMTAAPADVAIPEVPDAGSPVAAVAQAPAKPPPPPVTAPVAPPPVTAPVKTVEAPEQGPVAPAKLLLKVLAGRRPAAATVYVKSASGAPQRVVMDRKARKPVELMLPPGEYRLDVLSQGYLAQSRKVTLSREAAPTVSFTLAKAPVKKSQKVRVKKELVVLPRAPRFAERQAAPRKGSTAGLALLVDMFVRDESLRLRIEGHTDNKERPAAAARKALSEARANAVAKALVDAGLEASRIDTVGLGDSRPKAPNLLPRGRELNRRVEFVLLRAK